MKYQIKALSISNQNAVVYIKQSDIDFSTISKAAETLPNPAELFLGSFASCVLKNAERFSRMMKFTYTKATLDGNATRLENPPRMNNIGYNLSIYSTDKKLNTALLKKNIEKFGTIYNTVKSSYTIWGRVNTIDYV